MNTHANSGLKAFNQKVMPTNASKVTSSSINKVLGAIKHIGRPGKGGSHKKLSS